MSNHVFTTFNSAANNGERLEIVWAGDGDMHFTTYRADYSYNAHIRFRAYHGGGANTLLHSILNGLVVREQDIRERDFLNLLFASAIPNDYRTFTFRCDDNPGSHLKIAIAEEMFGLQTNCHDEEKDSLAGGLGSRQGEGAMIWIPRGLAPRVYDDLKAVLIDGINPNPVLYDPPFRPYIPEMHI